MKIVLSAWRAVAVTKSTMQWYVKVPLETGLTEYSQRQSGSQCHNINFLSVNILNTDLDSKTDRSTTG